MTGFSTFLSRAATALAAASRGKSGSPASALLRQKLRGRHGYFCTVGQPVHNEGFLIRVNATIVASPFDWVPHPRGLGGLHDGPDLVMSLVSAIDGGGVAGVYNGANLIDDR